MHKQTIIGRNVNLLININDISVSTKHAILEMNNDFSKCYLCDLGAKNGIFVNNQIMEPLTKKRLHHGDRVTFGANKTVFKFISTKQEEAQAKCSDSDNENVD